MKHNLIEKNGETLQDRLRFCAEKAGNGVILAQKSAIPRRTLESYLSGISEPNTSRLVAISTASEVDIAWLATGEGSPEARESQPVYEPTDIQAVSGIAPKYVTQREGMVSIPMINITASAGGGAVVLDETAIAGVVFNAQYLRTIWNINPKDLFCMEASGESMEPSIKSGEFMLVSQAHHHKSLGDGIYIIRMNGNVLVKRLQCLPSGKIKISSDNTAYEPYEIALNDGIDFMILGKVVLVHGIRRV